MSRGLSKQQQAIMTQLSEPYWEFHTPMFRQSTNSLMYLGIGTSKNSLNRAIRGLYTKGLVDRRKVTLEVNEDRSTWEYEYWIPAILPVIEQIEQQAKEQSQIRHSRLSKIYTKYGINNSFTLIGKPNPWTEGEQKYIDGHDLPSYDHLFNQVSELLKGSTHNH